MAVNIQSGAWNSSSILQGYGLMAVIGPYEPTKADVKRFNSRSGGAHAGHGNWMQTFNPRPVIKDGPPTPVYDYGLGAQVLVQSRLPSLATRQVSKFRGLKNPKVTGLKKSTVTNILKIGSVPETVAIDDPILEKNRKNSDVSMKSQNATSSNAPTSPTESELAPMEDSTFRNAPGPNDMRVDEQVTTNTIGPNPTQHLHYNNPWTQVVTKALYNNSRKASKSPEEKAEPKKIKVDAKRNTYGYKSSSDDDMA